MEVLQGYPRERFPGLTGDSFNCGICSLVCRDPQECVKCGAMYCTSCIDDWISKKNECPAGCSDARNSIKPISGALAKLYKNLDIKCKYTEECDKVVKLIDLAYHEMMCQLPKCEFFQFCGNHVRPSLRENTTVCDNVCALLKSIKEANSNWVAVYESIRGAVQKPRTAVKEVTLLKSSDDSTEFKWDNSQVGRHVEISNNQKSLFLKEQAYIFRSVIGDKAMMGGVHYWEIHADIRTEHELKVGVALTKDFNFDTSFSDFELGYAYYGLGQLRHSNNSGGGSYGKKWKKEGVLGVCLNMNRGTLSFALDEEFMGEAFKSEKLKKGPIYPAVSLLHLAGCKLVTGKPVPKYFMKFV